MNNKYNLSLRIVRQMRRGFGTWCTNSYISDKTPSRCPLDASTGRSMVEMLGVLAIIGVLSVGAIAGYSKAMMKYKLNKQTEQLNSIFSGMYQLWNKSEHSMLNNVGNIINYKSVLIKLNIIPPEMIKDSKIIDAMGNEWLLALEKSSSKYSFFKITISNIKSSESCINILNFSKEMKAAIWQTHFIASKGNEDNYTSRVYGDSDCIGNHDCLKDLTVAKMGQLCDTCNDTDACAMRILWFR
jgi:type II secretory pathway pseudopilin PulG